MPIFTMPDIPKSELPSVLEDLEFEGMEVVEKIEQPDGLFTLKVQKKSQTTASGSTSVGSTALSSFGDKVPIPPPDKMNVGLSACRENTMLAKFGKPGALTEDCSEATGSFKERVRFNFNVGPFRVTGLDYAVESLLQIFTDVRNENQNLYDQVKNDGMLCVRARRHNPAHYSNHSWGTAIDIFFGSGVVDQGVHLTQRGNLLLAPYFNRYGWYWGAGFSGDSVDSMHFEMAEETVQRIPVEHLFDRPAETVSYRPGPEASRILGDIVGLIKRARVIDSSFSSRIDFLATLPGGQLIFDTELQLDTDGWPDGKNKGDSSWQPTTSLRYTDAGSINANKVPYFVLPLPTSWPARFGIKLGDIAAVVSKNKLAFATFADQGPGDKLGEGSLELLRRLGEERLRPNGRVINSGMGPGVITIVFPGSGISPGPQDEQSFLNYIENRGSTSFQQLGGILPSELGIG